MELNIKKLKMKNNKFIIHNNTNSFYDFQIFEFIVYVMEQGLLSNNKTEYCGCTVRRFRTKELVCLFKKTKNNYRIDVYEEERKKNKC